jgi:hypothetical protein
MIPTNPRVAAAARLGVKRSPRTSGGQQQRPKRRGELQRENLCQRDQRDRQKPQVLPGKMQDVAHDMQATLLKPDRAQGAT